MKKNTKPTVLLFLSIVLSVLHANAQNHKNYKSSPEEVLPANRTAFLFCYNSIPTYKNPATPVLIEKKSNMQSVIQNRAQEKPVENVCLSSNISEDELWVETYNKKLQDQQLDLEIYNANGEMVYIKKIEQNLHKINICDFTAGTFLVKFGDNVQKMVIE